MGKNKRKVKKTPTKEKSTEKEIEKSPDSPNSESLVVSPLNSPKPKVETSDIQTTTTTTSSQNGNGNGNVKKNNTKETTATEVENKDNSNSDEYKHNDSTSSSTASTVREDMDKLVDGIVDNVIKTNESEKAEEEEATLVKGEEEGGDKTPTTEEEENEKDSKTEASSAPSFAFNLRDEVETPYGLAEIIKICDPVRARDITTTDMETKLINRYVLQSTCWIMDGNVRPTYYLLETQIKRLTLDYLQKVSPMTLIRRADIGRIRGNEYFVKKDFANARDEYLKAQWFIMSFTEDKTAKAEEMNSFKAHKFSIIIPLFNNLATVYNKLECFKDSIVASRNSVKLLEEFSRQERKISEKNQHLDPSIGASNGNETQDGGDLHVGGTEVIRLLKSPPINWDFSTINRHQQKALMVLGTAYHYAQEYENSNIYLKLCNDPKQHTYVANLITKNNQKIKKNNNKLSAAFSKSLSSSSSSKKHKLTAISGSCSPSKKKMKQDDKDSPSFKTNDKRSTGNAIMDWCKQNRNLVYLGAAALSLGAAYTVVMMRKKKQ